LPHAITMQLSKKWKMIDYIYMYYVYKLPYKIPIFNSLATIIQLINLLMQCISKDSCTLVVIFNRKLYNSCIWVNF
jgi:hypothetical protein